MAPGNRSVTRCGKAWLLLACLCLQPGITALGHPHAEQKRVLLLLETSGGPAGDLFTVALTETLREVPDEVDLYSEVLDANRFDEPGQDAILADFIRRKYEAVPIDVLIAGGPRALAFATRYRDALFANAPILFAAVSEANPQLDSLPDGVTGIVSHFDLTGTVELALALQPKAAGIVVVSGASPRDRAWEARARQRLSSIQGRMEVRYLAGLPLDSLLSELGELPRDTIVIMTTMLEDGTGRRLIPSAAMTDRVSAASSAPVYGVYETYIGHGIVGGYVDPFRVLGVDTAALARRILKGESVADIPVRRSASEYVADWRQLQRWKLDESRLPAGTRVLFREPSLWSEYKWPVAFTLLVVALQAVTIGALLFQRRRRREAEIERRESEFRFVAQLSHLNRVTAMGEFAASMAHELMQPLSVILNNADFAIMQLEKNEADSAPIREVVEEIREEDRRAVDIIRSMRRFLKHHEVAMRPIELKPLVEEVIHFTSVEALDRQVILTFESDRGLPTVAGDRVHLQQVLMNLILNAMDAIDAAGAAASRKVLVSARWEGTGPVMASVSDTGEGIPEDRLETIFNPFYTTKKNGIGMGLAIIRTIIEAHHGRVWAENNSSGGATFHFTLPRDIAGGNLSIGGR